jgi:hypothetical protein
MKRKIDVPRVAIIMDISSVEYIALASTVEILPLI